ncbi:unnamed protein product [Angiostrongylus costaricensis]|uniref:EB domain-containing protein n=1 Tax=Angiostrongylus costaricensis TaxID=334426 RepID=A0A0R3PF18_ANGCS|nr:unnamed protein product [Angiostrongylus costaricensis]
MFAVSENRAPTTALSESSEIEDLEEVEDFGECRDGQRAIGECVAELCPRGYTCEDNLCCEKVKTEEKRIEVKNSTGATRAAQEFTKVECVPSPSKISTPKEAHGSLEEEVMTSTKEDIDYENTNEENEEDDILSTFSTKSTSLTKNMETSKNMAIIKPDIEKIVATRNCPVGEAIGGQ